MRFKLTLAVDRRNNNSCILPINYQYELSSWIYHTIHNGNPEFSRWLHERGFINQNRRFKLFTFSQLKPRLYKVDGDRFVILSDLTELFISFYLPDAVTHFIKGVFQHQHFDLGDRLSSCVFQVIQIEKLPDIETKDTMRFKTVSPVIISRPDETTENPKYLSPEDPEYEDYFLNNLVNKYVALINAGTTEPVRNIADASTLIFKPVSQVRSKLIRIKSGTPKPVDIRGYLFEFELTAPEEIIKIGYYGGFGEKNSIGFGCCEVTRPHPKDLTESRNERPDRVRQDLSESSSTNPHDLTESDRTCQSLEYKSPNNLPY